MLKDLKLFLALLGPYKTRVRFALLVGGVAGLCTGVGITLGAEKLFSIVLNGEQSIELKRIILVASIFPLLFLTIGVSTFLSTYHLNYSGLGVIRDLRAELFSHIQRLPLAFFQTKKTGDLIARLTADTQAMQYALTITGRDLTIAPLTFPNHPSPELIMISQPPPHPDHKFHDECPLPQPTSTTKHPSEA